MTTSTKRAAILAAAILSPAAAVASTVNPDCPPWLPPDHCGMLPSSEPGFSALRLEGDCSCTDIPHETCDPGKSVPGLAEVDDEPLVIDESGTYIIDQEGDVWYCESGECTLTPIRV